jgi:hypothetical protein
MNASRLLDACARRRCLTAPPRPEVTDDSGTASWPRPQPARKSRFAQQPAAEHEVTSSALQMQPNSCCWSLNWSVMLGRHGSRTRIGGAASMPPAPEVVAAVH